MNIGFSKLVSLGAVLMIAASQAFAQNANRHVVVVTIDGFRPDFYLDEKWNAPNLKEMKQTAYAYGVNSVFPSITYPSHTTIVTGVQPAKHGVFYNGMFAKDEATKGKIYWRFDQITSPTLWGVAQQAGLKAASVNWPVSVGAPTVFDISDVGDQGPQVMNDSTTPLGISSVLKDKLFNNAPRIANGTDQNVARIAAWVIATDKPNFMTVHLLGMDGQEHRHGRSGPEIEHAIVLADSAVGIMRRAIADAGLTDSTIFIVTGDHGFDDVTTTVNPNVWLKRWGLLDSDDQWKAKFHVAGGGAFLFLKDKSDTATLTIARARLKALPEAERRFFVIEERARLDSIGADPNVAVALSGINGAAFGARVEGQSLDKGSGGTHGYFPDTRNIQTGFVAEGSALNKHVMLQEMNLRDISTIVTKYLGLRMPSSDGTLPSGLFK